MNLKEMQKTKKEFDKKRRWDRHRASNVFVHLVEEIGEIGRHINYEEGYKEKGKNSPDINRKELEREFAQTLILNAPETAVFRRHVLEAHSGSHLLTNLRF